LGDSPFRGEKALLQREYRTTDNAEKIRRIPATVWLNLLSKPTVVPDTGITICFGVEVSFTTGDGHGFEASPMRKVEPILI